MLSLSSPTRRDVVHIGGVTLAASALDLIGD
jgi:hypothetical protein